MFLPWFLILLQASPYESGVSLFEQGRLTEAREALTVAVKTSPGDARAWKALGVVHASQEDFELAEPAFSKACSLNPRLDSACYFLGRTRYALNRFEPALDALRRALPYDRNAWRVRLGIAQALEALQHDAEAESEFQAAIRSGPEMQTEPRLAYSTFLFRQGRVSESMEKLGEILRAVPESKKAHLDLGRILAQMDRLDEAAHHLEQAGDEPGAHLLLSKVYFRLGRNEDARKQFDQGSRTVK